MSEHGLDRLFEQMLAEPQGAEDPVNLTVRSELGAALPHLPDEVYEYESAQFLLDRVTAEKSSAPPELVAAMTAEVMRETRKIAVDDPRMRAVAGWGWTAGTVAAVVLVAVVISGSLRNKVTPVAHAVTEEASSKTRPRIARAPAADAAAPVVERSSPALPKASRPPETVYTALNPPLALTSHAVTVDDYPPDSIRLQEQGRVQVQYTIGVDGNVSACAVTLSSGFSRLDEAACILVNKWAFKPATVIGGAPVAVTIPAEIVFALK